MFLPLPEEDFKVNLTDSKDLILQLLDMLPSMYASSANYDSAFVNVLRAASKIAQPFGAKLLFFQFSPQLANIPSLKPKNNPSASERLDLLNSSGTDFATTGNDLSH